MKTALLEVAERWLQAGFSVIPVREDKTAIQKWGDRKVRPYELDELRQAFNNHAAKRIAVVTGYGGLVCFDFDPDKHGRALEAFDIIQDFYTPWADTAEGLGVIPAMQDTQSGGRHALIVCPHPTGNTKLASVPARADGRGQEFHTTIETRGDGGYFVLHDLTLDPQSIPSITQAQYNDLLEAALLLDRLEDTQSLQAVIERRGSGAKASASRKGLVGWFNEHHTVQEILQRNDYKLLGGKYLAPDSTSGNAGVVLFRDEHGFELCYSHHSDALGDGHAHDAFDTFKVLEHGGDFTAAKDAVLALQGSTRFSFSKEPSRARGVHFSLDTNSSNAVQDATTICGQPLATNDDLASNSDPDLRPNPSEDGHKSESASNAVQDAKSNPKLRKRTDLGPNGGHKRSGPSPSQKPDLRPSEEPIRGEIRTWGERAIPPAVQWTVHYLIQDNAENLIAGEPGVGKSWISGDLAVAVATGGQFLDRHTQQGSVLIINFDDPSESLPRMFAERSARGRHYEFNELPIYYWQPDENKPYPSEGVITPNVFEFLLREIRRIKPRLIIVDAFSSAFPNLDGNKGQDAIVAFEALRQLRTAAGKPSSLVLVDHTPKATLQDSKRRGVSGSQQKHAKTRTVHIIRHVDPGEVNGDDVLEWEVFKANAAPRQEPIGVDREMDGLLNTAKLTTRQLPERGTAAKNDRAAKAAITYLASRAGEVIARQDLLAEVVSMANVAMRTARRGLASSEFLDHPQIRMVELGGRGNPQGFMYEPDTAGGRVSLYEQFRTVMHHPTGDSHPHVTTIREAFAAADAGDDDAKDRIDQYLARDEIRAWVLKTYPMTQKEEG